MKGCQTPRIKIEPPRTDTEGLGAAKLMQAYGVMLDEWQQLVVNAWLGVDQLGQYTATSAGLSVPRQNGKNVIVEAREFYGLVINGEHILHTAHQLKTAKASFRRLVNMFTDKRHPEIMKLVKKIRYGLGEESIELNNGGIIEFASRSRQAARGYAGISLVVYDEAQELTDDQAEAIMSTLSASSTGTRQLIYIGTPPYIGCTGEVFRRFRKACIFNAGNNQNLHNSWHEWGLTADNIKDINLADKALWYEANPALGSRLTEEFTMEEFNTLSPDGFARERLGWWSKPAEAVAVEFAINPEAWERCKSDEKKPEGKSAYAVRFTPDGTEVILAGAVIPDNGKARITHIATEPTGRGLVWLADWLNERYKKASCVVIDGVNGTDVLIDKICKTWVMKGSVIKPTAQDVITATNMLINDLNEENVTWYSEQEVLNESAITATKRIIGRAGGFAFGGQTSAPITACSLALWGCRTCRRNPLRKMKIG